MTDKSDLGNRMKDYEQVTRTRLTRRLPMIIRVDGKAFHTFTKGLKKPWDKRMVDGMTEVAKALMRDVQGAKIAFVFSDEVSVLVTDNNSINTDSWFDKQIQKMVSVSASIATYSFNTWSGLEGQALFDSRCFLLPNKTEVCNYFLWRQQNATRNSIISLAQQHFSHKTLQRVNSGKAQDMLMIEKSINWNDCEIWQKRGWCVTKKMVEFTDKNEPYFRTVVETDWEIPIFTQNREYIENLCIPKEKKEKESHD